MQIQLDENHACLDQIESICWQLKANIARWLSLHCAVVNNLLVSLQEETSLFDSSAAGFKSGAVVQ